MHSKHILKHFKYTFPRCRKRRLERLEFQIQGEEKLFFFFQRKLQGKIFIPKYITSF